MPKPNYAFAKRQREIAKKQKANEKRARKAAGLPDQPDGDELNEAGTDAPGAEQAAGGTDPASGPVESREP